MVEPFFCLYTGIGLLPANSHGLYGYDYLSGEPLFTDDKYTVSHLIFSSPDEFNEDQINKALRQDVPYERVIDDALADHLRIPGAEGMLRLCCKLNLAELEKLDKEIKYWKKRKRPDKDGDDVRLRLKFLEGVRERFKAWYTKNGFDIDDQAQIIVDLQLEELKIVEKDQRLALEGDSLVAPIGRDHGVTPASKTQRLRLSASKKEALQQRIVDAVREFIDRGDGTQEQAFVQLAKDSRKRFGLELTKGQIEGHYKRNKKRMSDR